MATIHHLPVARARGGLSQPGEELLAEVERRLRDDRPDIYRSFYDGVRPVSGSRFDRFTDWLGDKFSGPRGLAYFASIMFPITVAAFCAGYFGLRELLTGVGL